MMEKRGLWEKQKDTTRHREVCNTFHNVIVILIIINFYIKFRPSNIIQYFIRMLDRSKAIKVRLDKTCQHKLGPGGYSNLAARIVSIKKTILHPNNKLQNIFHLYWNVKGKFMTLCKYASQSIQWSSHIGRLESWLPSQL